MLLVLKSICEYDLKFKFTDKFIATKHSSKLVLKISVKIFGKKLYPFQSFFLHIKPTAEFKLT